MSPDKLHSAARAEARDAARRNGAGLFGGQGLLAQLRAGEEAAAAALEMASLGGGAQPGAQVLSRRVVGGPLSGELRAAERRAAKDERNRLLLEERALRLEAEAQEAAAKRKRALAPMPVRGVAGSASAPELHAAETQDDPEKARLRLACKMQMLDFFKGYSSNGKGMSVGQVEQLLAKLNTGPSAGAGAPGGVARNSDGDFDDTGDWEEPGVEGFGATARRSFGAGGELSASFASGGLEGGDRSIQQRLQHVSEMCNRVFEEDMDDLDL